MKKIISSLVMLLSVVFFVQSQQVAVQNRSMVKKADSDPITGTWDCEKSPGIPFTLTLKLDGVKVTGTQYFPKLGIRREITGSFHGDQLFLKEPNTELFLNGEVLDGKIINGRYVDDSWVQVSNITWEGTRR